MVSYDEDAPSMTLSNGDVHKADVIIAADGETSRDTIEASPADSQVQELNRQLVSLS